MRVLMLCASEAAPHLDLLVRRLPEEGVEAHFAGDPELLPHEPLREDGVVCHPVAIRHKLDLRARAAVRAILRTHAIDVVHTISGRDAYVGLKARGRRRPPAVAVRRGAYARVSRIDPVERTVYGGADRIVTVSRDLERHLRERGVPAERLVTIYTGVWHEGMQVTTRDLKADLGLPRDVFLLGFLGQNRPVKGLDVLLDALQLVRERQSGFHLLVGGLRHEGGGREVASRGLAEHATFLGWVDPPAFTPNLDALVVPSRIDALPRGAIEATVMGTPVIASRVGGLPEILDDGRAGVLVPPEDPAALAAALLEAMRDPAPLRAKADAALRRNRELFGLARSVEEHLRLYRELASG